MKVRTVKTRLRISLVLAVLLASVACTGTAAPPGTAQSVGPATTAATAAAAAQPMRVVAIENFWGSIASQLGGNRVAVTSIIANPDTDPHDYEPTPADARAIASAQYVIVNGIGYDPWASKLLAANPNAARVVLTVGDLVGLKAGDNPHRWYSPGDVRKVIEGIIADYKRVDAAGVAYYDTQRTNYVTKGLASYTELIAAIKTKYAGTPVGATESIFEPMARELGLSLITPEGFMDAISEGIEPTASDKATADAQIKNKQIKVFVFNSQNATPDVAAQLDLAKSQGVETTPVTETLDPPSATFQDWQVTQLKALQAALAKATGR